MAYFSLPATTNLTIARRELCASILEQTKQLARNMIFKLCAGIITSIKNLLHSKRFIARHRNTETHFTRHRKLPFHVLICFLADFLKGSYQSELDKFFQALRGTELPERYVSKAAFTKARAKLDYGAFVELGQCVVSAFQRTFAPITWQGFRLLAIDSSTIRLRQATTPLRARARTPCLRRCAPTLCGPVQAPPCRLQDPPPCPAVSRQVP